MKPDTDSGLPRRRFLRSCAAGASAAVSLAANRRPNILYLHSHDTGRYIQPYGYSVPTPNLQKLAGEGVLFRQAFDAAPTCSPSRACLLTGHSAHNNGMFGLAHRGFSLFDYKEHILHTLQPAGYRSALIGIQHIARDPHVIGYGEIVPTKSATAQHVAPAAVNWLKNPPKQPFFLDVGFFETHREFHQPGPDEDVRYTLPPAPLPDTPATRRDMAGFKASARVLDAAVGDVLGALESAGLAGNTLVISTTDHGVPFPHMKCNLFDHGIGVSLILRGPGGFTGGKVCDAMVSQLDLFPTICELLDIQPPARLQGRSILPLIEGSRQEINEEIFAEVNYHAAYEPKRAVRTQRWKYIRHFDGRHSVVLPNCDDGFSKSLWIDKGWREQIVPTEHLYDLVFDPNERQNLIADKSLQSVAQEMRRRLDHWMEWTKDPILKGKIPAPPGAQANDPDGISPKEPVTQAG